jgi:hypothetical protein
MPVKGLAKSRALKEVAFYAAMKYDFPRYSLDSIERIEDYISSMPEYNEISGNTTEEFQGSMFRKIINLWLKDFSPNN